MRVFVAGATGWVCSALVQERDRCGSPGQWICSISSGDGSARSARRASEQGASRARRSGVRDPGFVPRLAAVARETSVSARIGEGLNRWPAAQCFGAPRVWRLALAAEMEGSFRGVTEEGVTIRNVAEAIGRRLHLRVGCEPADAVGEHVNRLAPLVGMRRPAASTRTHAPLDRMPEQLGVLTGLDQPKDAAG